MRSRWITGARGAREPREETRRGRVRHAGGCARSIAWAPRTLIVAALAAACGGGGRVEAYSAESPTTGPAGVSGSGGTGAAGSFGSGGTMGGTTQQGGHEVAGGPAGTTLPRDYDAGRPPDRTFLPTTGAERPPQR